jgi:ribose 5-phosphate isomerase B
MFSVSAACQLRLPALSIRIPHEAGMSDTSRKPRIALGADHAGFPVKETVRQFLQNAGYSVDDLGTWSEESVDYPDYGKAVGERVTSHQDEFGIAICGTGIGISIAANKVPGVRAALAHDVNTAKLAREHNDANVLAFGGRVVNGPQAIQMVQAFLSTPFAGGRHERRIEKIHLIELDERHKQ